MKGIIKTLSLSVKPLTGYNPEELISHHVSEVYYNPNARFNFVRELKKTGAIEENGRETPEYLGMEGKVDMVKGILSKAIGVLGVYFTGSPEAIQTIRMRAYPYIFYSSLPSEQAYGIMASLKIIQDRSEPKANLYLNLFKIDIKRLFLD